jgi:hypothetical protein
MKETETYISVHISEIQSLPNELLEKANRALEVFKTVGSGMFQVVSVSKTLDQVQLLCYPKFWNLIFPELTESWIMNFMDGGTQIQHETYDVKNPPILHHKELYIKGTHSDVPELRRISQKLEAAGCFENPIENRSQWIKVLNEKGCVDL